MKKLLFFLLLSVIGFAQTNIPSFGDTTDLKSHSGYGIVILEQYGGRTWDAAGGGLFHCIDSTYSEGTNAFNHITTGKQWARVGMLETYPTFQDVEADSIYVTGGAKFTDIVSATNLDFEPTRGTSEYQYYIDFSESASANVFPNGGPFKTYLYYAAVDRESNQDMTGDSRDVMFKGTYSNYGQNDSSSQVQGIGISVRNRSGGVFGTIKAGEYGVNIASGSIAYNAYGIETTMESYTSTDTLTNLFGLKVDLRNEGLEAQNEYGVYITNTNNSIAGASDAAIYVTDAGANLGWDYVVDANDATVGVAEFRGQNGETIANTTDGIWNFGAAKLQSATYNFGTAAMVTGTADSININFTPDLPALTAGMEITFIAEGDNTGAATLTVDGVEKNIYEQVGATPNALDANDIRSTMVVKVVYDGTQWVQISPSGN